MKTPKDSQQKNCHFTTSINSIRHTTLTENVGQTHVRYSTACTFNSSTTVVTAKPFANRARTAEERKSDIRVKRILLKSQINPSDRVPRRMSSSKTSGQKRGMSNKSQTPSVSSRLKQQSRSFSGGLSRSSGEKTRKLNQMVGKLSFKH